MPRAEFYIKRNNGGLSPVLSSPVQNWEGASVPRRWGELRRGPADALGQDQTCRGAGRHCPPSAPTHALRTNCPVPPAAQPGDLPGCHGVLLGPRLLRGLVGAVPPGWGAPRVLYLDLWGRWGDVLAPALPQALLFPVLLEGATRLRAEPEAVSAGRQPCGICRGLGWPWRGALADPTDPVPAGRGGFTYPAKGTSPGRRRILPWLRPA